MTAWLRCCASPSTAEKQPFKIDRCPTFCAPRNYFLHYTVTCVEDKEAHRGFTTHMLAGLDGKRVTSMVEIVGLSWCLVVGLWCKDSVSSCSDCCAGENRANKISNEVCTSLGKEHALVSQVESLLLGYLKGASQALVLH